MPFTINGIGTTYYGKKNIHVRQGVCEACQAATTLTSYDTASYFVLVFLPVAPLGTKRIVDECARCRRHRVMPLAKWIAFRASALDEVTRAQTDTPDDAAASQAAIETAIAFDDEDAFLASATIAESEHARHEDILHALAEGYSYFDHAADAEETYRAIVGLKKDDAAASEGLAVTIMRQGRPDDAGPIVERVFQDERAEGLWLVRFLIEAYQAQGDHKMAHSLLNRCETVFPATAKDPHHKLLRKTATRNSQAGTAVPPQSLHMGTRRHSVDMAQAIGNGHGRVAALIAMVAVPLALIAWLTLSYMDATSRKVWVVNGTDARYQVDINGQTRTLEPNHRAAVTLAEGEVVVRVLDSAIPVPEQRAVIETPLLTRLFRDHLFVLNPDRAAVLVWEETVYAGPSQPTRDDPYEIHSGELLYRFDGIDYPFTDFPDQIMSTQSGTVLRERVEHVVDSTPWNTAFMLLGKGASGTVTDYARNAISFEPDNAVLFDILAAWAFPKEVVAFVEPHLDDRPIRTEWHRAYQDAVRMESEDNDLLDTYRATLDADPENPERIYLYARLLDDSAEKEAAFLRAIDRGLRTERPGQWIVRGMLGTGRFEEALALIDRLGGTKESRQMMLTQRRNALLATGRFDEAIETDRARHAAAPDDASVITDYMILLMRDGRESEATQLVSDFVDELAQGGATKESLTWWRDRFEAIRLYQVGDMTAFGTAAKATSIGWLHFRGAISMGELEEAYRVLQDDEDAIADVDDFLALAIAAHGANEPALVEQCRAAAADLWTETMAPPEDRAAAWLTGTETPSPDQVLELRVPEVRTKLLLLTVMGIVHADDAAAYFAMARKLDYDTQFPHRIVEPALRTGDRTAGENGH